MTRKMCRVLKIAKMAQERFYEDTCTIYRYEKEKDSQTHITSSQQVLACKDQPCRISFSSIPATSDIQTADALSQSIKLFLSPDVLVKSGSRILVTHAGTITAYKNSSMPAVYVTHQEINLELEAVHP